MTEPSPAPRDGVAPAAGWGRNEAARRALKEGIERSRRLVERYRALLVQLNDPFAGPRVAHARSGERNDGARRDRGSFG